jgi:hypothetical protein
VSVDLDYGESTEVRGPQSAVMVNPRMLEYEALIAVNQLKLHETATVTLALKNIAMSFPAADYYGHPRSTQRHGNHFFEDMHSFIAAMAKRFRIDLAVTVGHPAMIATGPLRGHAVETGITIASTDALAADVVGAHLLGFTPQAVRHLWEAARLGIGESFLDRVEFRGLTLKEAIGTFTEAAYGKRLDFVMRSISPRKGAPNTTPWSPAHADCERRDIVYVHDAAHGGGVYSYSLPWIPVRVGGPGPLPHCGSVKGRSSVCVARAPAPGILRHGVHATLAGRAGMRAGSRSRIPSPGDVGNVRSTTDRGARRINSVPATTARAPSHV